MSIRQLLYAAFGFIFLAAGLITFWQLNAVRVQLGKIETARRHIVEVAAPLHNATQELEINAGESLWAMTYVKSHDLEEKERVGDAVQDFKNFHGNTQANILGYAKLAETAEQKEFGQQLFAEYQTLQKAAQKIMTDADERARQRTAMRATMEQLETLFADDLLARIDRTQAAETLAKIESALEMEVHVKETRAAYEAYMIQADEKLKQLAQQAKDQFDKACQAFGGTSPTPDEQRVLEKIQSQFQTVCAAGAIIFQATEDIDSGLKLLAATQKKIDQILDNKIEPLVTEGAQQARQAANVATTAAENAIRWAMIVIFTVLLAGLAIGGGVAFNISQRITGPLARMVQSANAIADGDLTLPRLSETSDEPGRVAGAFNRMVRSLKDLLAQTQQLSGQLGAATQEINVAAQQQLATLNESAASINQITTTSEQFKTTFQEFADRARSVQQAADESIRRAAEGHRCRGSAPARRTRCGTTLRPPGRTP